MIEASNHVVLCGIDRLGVRTLVELRRLGQEVVVVAPADQAEAAEAVAAGCRVIAGDYREESALIAAGLRRAKALVIAEDDDVANLHAALTARSIQPDIRYVLRIFNLTFGEQIRVMFRDCQILSATAIAAPAFVAAAIDGAETRELVVAGRNLELVTTGFDDPSAVAHVARRNGDTFELFPGWGGDSLAFVGRDGGSRSEQRRSFGRPDRWLVRQFRVARRLVGLADRRLRLLLTTLVLLAMLSTFVFAVFDNLEPIDALYFTVTVITTTGFGDISLRDAPAGLKIFGMGLMLLGAASLAVLYAIITDAIVGLRLARALGRPDPGLRDHVVVCGIGSIGYRIVELLHRLAVPVVAVDHDEANRFIPLLRDLGVPLVIGDVRLAQTLADARIFESRALVAATDDDFANLAAALTARSQSPDTRLVLRLFDPELARRVEPAFGASLSRSVSTLAAPVFAAAALGEQVIATVPVGRRLLVIARDEVAAESDTKGQDAMMLERSFEGRIMAVERQGETIWRPGELGRLEAGDFVIAVASRQGFADFLALVSGRKRLGAGKNADR